MPFLVGYLVLFLLVGFGFIFVHLMVGKLIRPAKPHDEKLTIYECGEPTIGSAWVQFDLRYYVVALLFVIFDVEVAFFFPWAVVFGKAAELGNPNISAEQRVALTVGGRDTQPLVPLYAQSEEKRAEFEKAVLKEKDLVDKKTTDANRRAACHFAGIAFVDILVFFGVLLIGFAYLWRRGDINWVRSFEAEKQAESSERESGALVGAGRS